MSKVKSFETYVFAISLAKLKDRIKEPQWQGHQPMYDFLKEDYDFKDIHENFKLDGDLRDVLDQVKKATGVCVDAEVAANISCGTFTVGVARLYHEFLRILVTWIHDQHKELPVPNNKRNDASKHGVDLRVVEFGDKIFELHVSVTRLHYCVNVLDPIMQLYIKAIKGQRSSLEDSNDDDKGLGLIDSRNDQDGFDSDDDSISPDARRGDEDDDAIDAIGAKSWPEVYLTWFKKITRQVTSALMLTDLLPERRQQLSTMDFTIIKQKAPNTAMEPLEKIVREVLKGTELAPERKEIMKVLTAIANSPVPTNRLYEQLESGWQHTFDGAMHTEAMIACHYLERDRSVSLHSTLYCHILMVDRLGRCWAFLRLVVPPAPFY